MQRLLLAGTLTLALIPVALALEPDAGGMPVNQVRDFMRKKLVHSQNVLEGLTMENWDQVTRHAQQLSLLSQAAAWQVLQTPEYAQRSTEFRRAADALTEAARKHNLDGATLAYLEVTSKCVSCHKYVRGVRIAAH